MLSQTHTHMGLVFIVYFYFCRFISQCKAGGGVTVELMAPCINSRRLLPNDGNSDCKYELRPAAGVDVARGQEIYFTSPHRHIITD